MLVGVGVNGLSFFSFSFYCFKFILLLRESHTVLAAVHIRRPQPGGKSVCSVRTRRKGVIQMRTSAIFGAK